MGMRDQYGCDLLEPEYGKEEYAYEEVWGVYKFQDGYHSGECVASRMTLYSAREEAQKRNGQTPEGAGYSSRVYRPAPRAKRRTPQKPGPRKL
jgi:hypothetical protein